MLKILVIHGRIKHNNEHGTSNPVMRIIRNDKIVAEGSHVYCSGPSWIVYNTIIGYQSGPRRSAWVETNDRIKLDDEWIEVD